MSVCVSEHPCAAVVDWDNFLCVFCSASNKTSSDSSVQICADLYPLSWEMWVLESQQWFLPLLLCCVESKGTTGERKGKYI